MSGEVRSIILHRPGRAREAIEEAQILFDVGHLNAYVNRLYYACFYAVSALLLTKGISTSRHSHLRILLHREFVKPEVLPVPLGQHFDRLFDSRLKGDYADFADFQAEEVSGWLAQTKQFVDQVEGLLRNTLPEEP